MAHGKKFSVIADEVLELIQEVSLLGKPANAIDFAVWERFDIWTTPERETVLEYLTEGGYIRTSSEKPEQYEITLKGHIFLEAGGLAGEVDRISKTHKLMEKQNFIQWLAFFVLAFQVLIVYLQWRNT